MIKIIDVTATYISRRGHKVIALDNVSLDIKKGEYVSITGPSGSGKSTMLHALGAMMHPESGQILIDDVNVYNMSAKERAGLRNKKIGFVFQTFKLIPYISALENVQVPLYLNLKDEKAQKERAAFLLERMGLADRMEHLPSELSVGQQQRVAIARMLANEPDLILADEPTGSLDPETGHSILEFMDQLCSEGKTIVMVTHDPEVAHKAGRRLQIRDGRIYSK